MTHETISWKRSLFARACRNQAARVTQQADGTLAIHIKNIRPNYRLPLLAWIVPFRPERRVALDSIGSYVWSECDGTRTMESMIERFAERYVLTFHEARAALTPYVQSLVQRGAVAMILPTDDKGVSS